MDGHGAGRLVPTLAGRVWAETEGSGPTVVLVPGGPGAAHGHYHPWFSALAARRTVVYLDQLGTGRSDRLADPAGYGVGLYADTLGVGWTPSAPAAPTSSGSPSAASPRPSSPPATPGAPGR